MPPKRAVELRFWEKVDKRGPDDCWPWTASYRPHGYGQFAETPTRIRPAHVVAYELTVGPVPDGLEIDHTCRNRGCCNPAHLEAVTHAENIRRGESPAAINARKTHCKHGHPFTPENVYWLHGKWRRCRTCFRRTEAAYRARRAAA